MAPFSQLQRKVYGHYIISHANYFFLVAALFAFTNKKSAEKKSLIFILIVIAPFAYQWAVLQLVSHKLQENCEEESGFFYGKPIGNGTIFYQKGPNSSDPIIWRLLAEERHKRIIVDNGKYGNLIFKEPGIQEVYLQKKQHPDCQVFNEWREKWTNRKLPFSDDYCVAIKSADGLAIDEYVEDRFSRVYEGPFYGHKIATTTSSLVDPITGAIYSKYVNHSLATPKTIHIFNLFFHGNKSCFSRKERKSMGSTTMNFYFPDLSKFK